MSEERDWSEYHRRLRLWLMLLALAAFFLARAQPSLGDNGLAGVHFPVWLSRNMLVLGIVVIYAGVLLRFVVRSRAEENRILLQGAKLNRALQRIDETRRRIDDLARHFGGALISERLGAWDAAFSEASAMPDEEDMRAIAAVAERLALFKAVAARIETVLTRLEERRLQLGFVSEDDESDSPRDDAWEAEARRLIDLLKRMDRVGHSFEARKTSLEQAIAETHEVLRDARRYFSNERREGAEDLHAKLDDINAALADIKNERRASHRTFWHDRIVFSVRLPIAVTLVLCGFAADAAFSGTQEITTALAGFARSGL